MNYGEIKDYWGQRAKENLGSPQATTNDFYMRVIELSRLKNTIQSLLLQAEISKIADIGCGDGYTTILLSNSFSHINFYGFDYSKQMLQNALQNAQNEKCSNISFECLDIVKNNLKERFQIIYTTRCLINIPSYELQLQALNNIYQSLAENGVYVMIENFLDGQEEFNLIRKTFELPEIKIRSHNLYFNLHKLTHDLKGMFEIVNISNISSLYYIISRVIYSKICQLNHQEPDYFDLHHKLASMLPDCGNYGPIKMLTLRRTS